MHDIRRTPPTAHPSAQPPSAHPPAARPADSLLACRRELAARGETLVTRLIGAAEPPTVWRHYPPGDAYDPAHHSQFFYHRHPDPEQPPGELGHLHVFVHGAGLPPGARPLVAADAASGAAPGALPNAVGPISHLVAVAIDAEGRPVRLFTTNRWVTGESWFAATDLIRMAAGFVAAPPGRVQLVGTWLTAVIRLFQPEIAALAMARDGAVAAYRSAGGTSLAAVLEDRRLEILAEVAIGGARGAG